jgi:prevent-host-death family protein
MKARAVSMRELQQNLKRVIARVERGETVELTRRRRVVARLVPVTEDKPVAPWPDLEKRSRAVFGGRIITPSPSEELIRDRGEW